MRTLLILLLLTSYIGLYMNLAITNVYAEPDYGVCKDECRPTMSVIPDQYQAYKTCIQICKLRIDLRELLKK